MLYFQKLDKPLCHMRKIIKRWYFDHHPGSKNGFITIYDNVW